jgi:hypothetical protein
MGVGYPSGSNGQKMKRSSVMSKTRAERFRIMAAECERQAELAIEEKEFREMQKRLAGSYHALAETEDWLDGRSKGVTGARVGDADYQAA